VVAVKSRPVKRTAGMVTNTTEKNVASARKNHSRRGVVPSPLLGSLAPPSKAMGAGWAAAACEA
jgi:hypothetical protein